MKKVLVTTMLKDGVKDNQGDAVRQSLHSLDTNFQIVTEVRVGKTFVLEFDNNTSESEIEKVAESITNTVIEKYTIQYLN